MAAVSRPEPQRGVGRDRAEPRLAQDPAAGGLEGPRGRRLLVGDRRRGPAVHHGQPRGARPGGRPRSQDGPGRLEVRRGAAVPRQAAAGPRAAGDPDLPRRPAVLPVPRRAPGVPERRRRQAGVEGRRAGRHQGRRPLRRGVLLGPVGLAAGGGRRGDRAARRRAGQRGGGLRPGLRQAAVGRRQRPPRLRQPDRRGRRRQTTDSLPDRPGADVGGPGRQAAVGVRLRRQVQLPLRHPAVRGRQGVRLAGLRGGLGPAGGRPRRRAAGLAEQEPAEPVHHQHDRGRPRLRLPRRPGGDHAAVRGPGDRGGEVDRARAGQVLAAGGPGAPVRAVGTRHPAVAGGHAPGLREEGGTAQPAAVQGSPTAPAGTIRSRTSIRRRSRGWAAPGRATCC